MLSSGGEGVKNRDTMHHATTDIIIHNDQTLDRTLATILQQLTKESLLYLKLYDQHPTINYNLLSLSRVW